VITLLYKKCRSSYLAEEGNGSDVQPLLDKYDGTVGNIESM